MKFLRLTGAALLAVVIVSGCSNVKEELKPAKLEAIEANYKLVQQWQRNTGAGQDARYQRLQPAVADGVIYSVDVKGLVSAWAADTGRRLWRHNLDTAVGGGVGVVDDTGFIGTLDGRVIAFSLSDGSPKWEAKTSSEVVSTPQANAEVVVAQAIDGRVFAFDVDTGDQRWTYDHPVPVLSLRANSAPLISNEAVFVGFDNGQLLSFNAADGQLRWSARVGQPQGKTELERLVDIDTAPIELGPYIYAAGFNARLVAVSRGTGRISWSQDVSTANNIAAGEELIIVSDVDSHIIAFNALDGSVVWRNKELHRRGVSAPVVFNNLVIAIDDTGYVHGLSVADGKLIARARVSSDPVLAQPFVIEQTLYVLDAGGRLTAYELEPYDGSISIWDMVTNRERGAIPTKDTGVKKPK